MDPAELALAVEKVVGRHVAAGVDRAEAQDCVQDAVVALLATAGGHRLVSAEAWLTVASRRRLVDHARRARRERAALARVPAPVTDLARDPGETVADRALAQWLAHELAALPLTTRMVCALLTSGMTHRQTAAELGLTVRSVESHVRRARHCLRTSPHREV